MLQPLAEIHEMVQQLQYGRGAQRGKNTSGASASAPAAATAQSSAVLQLQGLVGDWRRRGFGSAVVMAGWADTRPGDVAGRDCNSTVSGSALNTVLQVGVMRYWQPHFRTICTTKPDVEGPTIK